VLYLLPEYILLALGVAGVFVGIYGGRRAAGVFAVVGACLAGLGTIAGGALLARIVALGPEAISAQLPRYLALTFAFDPFSAFFAVFALGVCAISLLFSAEYVRETLEENYGEFLALICFASLAMVCLARARELITLYFSVEFLSITGYIMAGFRHHDERSVEAGLKYFLFGAVCSCLMLFGISYVYGATQTTDLEHIARALFGRGPGPSAFSPTVVTGLFMILVGLGFKVAMVPFHLWCPDVYEGAPTPVTAYLSVGPKGAGFAVLIRTLFVAFTAWPEYGMAHSAWFGALAIASAVTMTLGNLVAIQQRNIKRMLAYSSIAHAGYLLIGLAAAEDFKVALPAVLIYLVAYAFMNLGAFAVVIGFSRSEGTDELDAYGGLMHRAPYLAVAWFIFVLSLVGLPPTTGFIGKLYLFLAAIGAKIYWLAVCLVINSVISLYYYVDVARRMFIEKPATKEPIPVGAATGVALAICLAGTLLPVFFWPALEAWATMASHILGGPR